MSEHHLTRTLPAGASVTPDPPETDATELPIAALRGLAKAGDAAAPAVLAFAESVLTGARLTRPATAATGGEALRRAASQR